MATILDAQRLLTEVTMINTLNSKKGVSITPIMVGKPGIGKTQIVESVSKRFAKFAGVETDYVNYSSLDCSQTGDGDIAIPFAQENSNGKREVVYILHHIFTPIKNIEEELYEKAYNGGFLNGRIKLELDANGDEYLVYDNVRKLVRTALDFKKCGDSNKCKFGNELPADMKLALIKSGEVPVWMILLDELNRADQMVMKQMMNVILERNVNGYQLPWWVQIVAAVNPSSQGSRYATNEMDPAQWSRFLRLDVTANLEQWVSYGIDKGLDPESLEAIATLDDQFNGAEEKEEKIDIKGNPRSWEMVCDIEALLPIVAESGIFTRDELYNEKGQYLIDKDVATLVQGKVGVTAGAAFLAAKRDAGKHVKPVEIFNLKDKKIDKKVVEKLSSMTSISKRVVVRNCSNYLKAIGDDLLECKKAKTGDKAEKWSNFCDEMKEFISLLEPVLQTMFGRSLINLNTEKGVEVFSIVAPSFTSDLMKKITEMTKAQRDANNM